MELNITQIQEVALNYAKNNLLQDLKDFIPFFENYTFSNVLYVIDFVCAMDAAYVTRLLDEKNSLHLSKLTTFIITLLTYFGGTLTKILCGVPCGGFYSSSNFISIFLGWMFICASPLDIGYIFYKHSYLAALFRWVFDQFVTVYCITSWGSDVVLNKSFSLTAAIICSLITCFGGFVLRSGVILNTNTTGFFNIINKLYTDNQNVFDRCFVLTILYLIILNPYSTFTIPFYTTYDDARLYLLLALSGCSLFELLFGIDPCSILIRLINFIIDILAPNRKCYKSTSDKIVTTKPVNIPSINEDNHEIHVQDNQNIKNKHKNKQNGKPKQKRE